MKFCKYAETIKNDDKHIRCKRDGSIRNIKKRPCANECAYKIPYKNFSLLEKIKRRFHK